MRCMNGLLHVRIEFVVLQKSFGSASHLQELPSQRPIQILRQAFVSAETNGQDIGESLEGVYVQDQSTLVLRVSMSGLGW